jgi:P2 family phage contractile tail tube protein
MSDVFNWEAANLFCGDHDTATSNHLSLLDLKLPQLEENTVDWTPGGSPVASEVETHINKLEATFNLAGFTPEVMKLIGISQRQRQTFTAYGVLRGRKLGNAVEAKAIMQARLGRVNPTSFKRGDLHQHEYSIKSIVHYELYFGNDEIYYWDMFTNEFRVGGEDINFDTNKILRIPGSTGVATGASASARTIGA